VHAPGCGVAELHRERKLTLGPSPAPFGGQVRDDNG